MSNSKMTRRALLTSVMALMLCFAMLTGTTFAWFTDQETSANNKIIAGNLDVQLLLWDGSDDSTDNGTGVADYIDIGASKAPIFGEAGLAQNSLNTLWEPGKTQVAYLAIKNAGTLDFKYIASLDTRNPAGGKDLYKVMSYNIIRDAKDGAAVTWDATTDKAVVPGIYSVAEETVLKKGDIHYFALAIHMDEQANNDYQGGMVEFDINIIATQLNSEEDAFGPDYDKNSKFENFGFGAMPVDNSKAAYEIKVVDTLNSTPNSEVKIAQVNVPAAAVDANAKEVKVTVEKKAEANAQVVITTEQTATTYDITVEGLKNGNTEPLKVTLPALPGLDPAKVKLYHYGTEIPCTYDPAKGEVTFQSATFSPFTVVYEAESEYVAPEADKTKLPAAKVTPYIDTQNITWGNYGKWSPTEGLEANLEAAYTFACTEDLEAAKKNPYAYWYCDFYVELDKALGANQIFLGGNYGSFGWVGFHNGDLTLDANTEIGLLESVTNNPWTYLDVVQNVGTFICGVGDVDDALSGATFTVMLRLTNPENDEQYYDIETINYTFN